MIDTVKPIAADQWILCPVFGTCYSAAINAIFKIDK